MSRIVQYELRELLGEGGIGQVHAAFDTVLRREVAIKSLRPELLSDPDCVARFHAEATSLARLNHPNITTVHALVADGPKLYMVMERVRGETVQDLLRRRNGPLGAEQSLAITAQAAEGLAYAHSMGVIHRDIKPANLMITSDGLVKIMDFGIARVRGSQRLTRDGSIIGTLAYMAPEQLRGEPGDERSDVYSLAVVLYEMLTGGAPFAAATEYELMQKQLNSRPRRVSSLVPGIESRVDGALTQALSKKPDHRFDSARAFRKALGVSAKRLDPSGLPADTGRTDAASLPSVLPAWQTLTRSRVPLMAGAAVVAAILVVLGILVLAPSGSGSLRKEAIAQPPKSGASHTSQTPQHLRNPLVLPPPGSR